MTASWLIPAVATTMAGPSNLTSKYFRKYLFLWHFSYSSQGPNKDRGQRYSPTPVVDVPASAKNAYLRQRTPFDANDVLWATEAIALGT